MIPKIIHYCWFGGNPLPELAMKCIESWRTYFPDYEIKEWNEDNFDVNIIPYTKEAYENKKYAFVSDYARFWILYNHGGIYFDTDVEVIKKMDDIIEKGSFMGCEKKVTKDSSPRDLGINPGLGLGSSAGHPLLKELIDAYANIHFCINGVLNQKTIVEYTTELLCRHGLKVTNDIQECAGIYIYPKDFFCPLSLDKNKEDFTDNTCSIHHYMASWANKNIIVRLYKFIKYKILFKLIPSAVIKKIVEKKRTRRESNLGIDD